MAFLRDTFLGKDMFRMYYKVFLLIGFISAIVYANAIHNDFLYDDEVYITENPHIRDMENIPYFFTHPEYLTSYGHKAHYRPLVVVSYALNYAVGGLNPAGYRIVNLLFHIGTAFLLFLTVQTMLPPPPILPPQGGEGKGGGSRVETQSQETLHSTQLAGVAAGFSLRPTSYFIALASALIFAVHPFNSEAVNYITARSSVMSGFFYLLAFYCWVRFRGEGKDVSRLTPYLYLCSLLAFLLGMLSKEVVITLPIMLWLYDIYFIHPFRTPHSALRTLVNWRTYLPYIPFVLLVLAPLVIREVYQGGAIPYFKRDIASQIYTMLPVLTRYLKLLFLPTGLSIAHYVEIYNGPLNYPVILSAGILLLYVINAIYLFMSGFFRWRALSFFMIWFIVTLIPVIIIPLNRMMQENRCYISGVGFALFLSLIFWQLAIKIRRVKLTYSILVILLVIYYGIGTVQRNMVWTNGVTLWTDALKKYPSEPHVYHNLSVFLIRHGSYERAKDVLYRGIRLSPADWRLHYKLGTLYTKTGELDHALHEYEMASRFNPSEAEIYYNMAIVLEKIGRLNDSAALLQTALKYAAISNDKMLLEEVSSHIDGMGKKEIPLPLILSP